MGALKHLESDTRLPLIDLHRVGRNPSCALVLDDPFASREHAIVTWTGSSWELRDLGGQNGTSVDGRSLAPGTSAQLSLGARLSFGTAHPTHELIDDGPPEPLAKTPEGRWLEGRGGMLELPGPLPRVVLRSAYGWCLEVDGIARAVTDGELLDDNLRLHLPSEDARTRPRPTAAPPRAQFRVSSDEEQVELAIIEGGRSVDLGVRSHHYLLLTLARARLADAERGLPERDVGWLDAERLAHQLRVEPKYLNVLVHRARRQIQDAGLDCAHQIVERRDAARQIRLGFQEIGVER